MALPYAAFLALCSLPLSTWAAPETVLGIYMFHRHGDRTAKAWPPANLTQLGYSEVHTSGSYYRSRYIVDGAPYQISSISPDVVLQSDIQVTAPDDTVLQNSAAGFLQGLYPPTDAPYDQELLRNGTVITAPMQGYQLIPVGLVTSGTSAEDSTWLQSTSGCANAEVSSNDYFSSDVYNTLLKDTQSFYGSIWPVVNGTFNKSSTNFFNAYEIFDLINVAEIHNQTISSADLITNETFHQLRILANSQQWDLAYNASEPIRAVAGATLAAEATQFLNSTITSYGATKIGIQFGSYNVFSSFFGLANVNNLRNDASSNTNLFGVADYASAMTFELFTNTSTGPFDSSNFPSTDDIYVRFLWHNGTTTNTSQPVAYPLFGQDQVAMKWDDFQSNMNQFSIGSTQEWCSRCGNYTGVCANTGSSSQGGDGTGESNDYSGSGCSNGISPAVNGVIGAMVALAVILALEGLILLVGGYRIVSKKRLAQGARGLNGSTTSGKPE